MRKILMKVNRNKGDKKKKVKQKIGNEVFSFFISIILIKFIVTI